MFCEILCRRWNQNLETRNALHKIVLSWYSKLKTLFTSCNLVKFWYMSKYPALRAKTIRIHTPFAKFCQNQCGTKDESDSVKAFFHFLKRWVEITKLISSFSPMIVMIVELHWIYVLNSRKFLIKTSLLFFMSLMNIFYNSSLQQVSATIIIWTTYNLQNY